VANRITDISGESVIHRIASEISRQRAGCVCAIVNIKWFDFSKKAVFCNFDLAYLPCHIGREEGGLLPADIPCDEEDH
jgi:hypothetical protein